MTLDRIKFTITEGQRIVFCFSCPTNPVVVTTRTNGIGLLRFYLSQEFNAKRLRILAPEKICPGETYVLKVVWAAATSFVEKVVSLNLNVPSPREDFLSHLKRHLLNKTYSLKWEVF
jgi:hypothetical protein